MNVREYCRFVHVAVQPALQRRPQEGEGGADKHKLAFVI